MRKCVVLAAEIVWGLGVYLACGQLWIDPLSAASGHSWEQVQEWCQSHTRYGPEGRKEELEKSWQCLSIDQIQQSSLSEFSSHLPTSSSNGSSLGRGPALFLLLLRDSALVSGTWSVSCISVFGHTQQCSESHVVSGIELGSAACLICYDRACTLVLRLSSSPIHLIF